ncbi:MAG: hypothetical protein HY908_00590, partial [Myxococcales bacterium]|nr:hypothetical protein [Myxococcales bacterium]
MSGDPNKKSARTFQCRDVLWDTFEQMARDLECSVDYLINEAMKQYARQRTYGGRTPFPSRVETPPPPQSSWQQGAPHAAPAPAPQASMPVAPAPQHVPAPAVAAPPPPAPHVAAAPPPPPPGPMPHAP